MLRLLGPRLRLCDGMNRREMMHVAGLGLTGLTLPQLLHANQNSQRRAKACIVLFMLGGPPQQETFDLKPNAPAEIRGPLSPIPSNVPGIQVGELLPHVARVMDRIAVLRAVSTNDNAHSSSGYWMLTGYPHQPTNTENAKPGSPNDWPCIASVVQRLLGSNGRLPGSVVLPEHIWNTGMIPWPGQDGGWLGRTADPWLLHCDPNAADFHVPGLKLPHELPPLRLDERGSLLEQVNRHLDGMERGGLFHQHNQLSHQAFDLLRSSQARRAFNLDEESPRVRDRYGRHRFGQSVLLARRLVEAGVRLVQVNWTRDADGNDQSPAWDTHAKHADLLKTKLCPPMDLAYSALLEDLDQRGLLDETLVVWTGEFGRTPKINAAAGRDHWGHVFSVTLAGGGIRGGMVHGASDKIAGFPLDGKVEPGDVTATIFHCLGMDPHVEIRDALGRPVPISRGSVIRQVLA